MIEQGFLKKHFVGRDNFIWWIGQIVSEEQWVVNFIGRRTETTSEHKGFDFRYKVRIMGYHTEQVSDEELPWASIMLPVTAGSGSRGASQSPNLSQGDFVYGFFLDGEDAQTPIILGIIGNNQYLSILNSPPESIFVPFSGFTNRDSVPRYGLPLSNEVGIAKQPSNPESSNSTSNEKTIQSNVGLESRNDGASKNQYDDGKKKHFLPLPSDCDPTPVGKIQNSIKNLIADIQRIRKTSSSWRTAVSTKISNIEKEIDKKIESATEFISEGLKWIINQIQKYTINKVNNTLKDTYYLIFPNERPKLKRAVEKANDSIACLFRKIISNLLKMVGKFLLSAVDKYINTPLCAVENFVGGLIGKLVGLITSAIDSILKPIESLISKVFDLADSILGFVIDLLSFLSCDEKPDCAKTKEWSIWEGDSDLPTIDISSLINKAKSVKKTFTDAIDPNNFNFDLDFSDVFEDSCNVGALFCGPPKVEFFGGGGNGASGNAIISAAGSILGVDVISPGTGYSSPPSISFVDACGKGRGAAGRVRINSNGQIEDVIMEESGTGYLSYPDGSRGGDGRLFAESGDTIVRRANGNYDAPYSAGDSIEVFPGDQVQSCSRSPYTIQSTQNIIAPTCNEVVRNVGDNPVSEDGDYPIYLEIKDVYIADPGFGYSDNDKIIISPNNGADLRPRFNEVGSLIGVDVRNGGLGFKEFPEMYIESKTGINAKLTPVFNVNRIGPPSQEKIIESLYGGYITVVDCVGKFNV